MNKAALEQKLRSHPFNPPAVLKHYNIQTLLSPLVPNFKTKLPKVEKKYIDLADGSKLGVDCWWQKDKALHPTLVVMRGFDGYKKTRKSHFVEGMSNKAYHFGFNVIHLKQRGETDTIALTKSLGYYADDLTATLEQFTQWGVKNIYVAGFSAGGHTVLFTLGKLGAKAKELLKGAVAISAPMTTLATWEHVEKNPLYDWSLLRTYKNLILRRVNLDPPGTWDIKELKTIKTKRQWVEKYINRWGYPEIYKTFEEMNQKLDALPMMKNIQIPTLIIHASDDPLTPAKAYNAPEIQNNPNIITILTKHGGHGGFFTFKPNFGDLDTRWVHNRALEFIKLLETL